MKPINVSLSKPELELEPYTGERGVYSAVKPNEDDLPVFQALCEQLGFEFHGDKTHCTVMYSKDAVLQSSDMARTDPDKQFWALVDHIEHWTGHDDKLYVVAGITSPSIVLEHAKLRRMGAKHSFTPFKAHVTLTSDAEMNDDLQQRIDAVNRELAENPRQVYFSQHKIADVKQ